MRSSNSPVSSETVVDPDGALISSWRPKMDLNVMGTAWADSSRVETPVRVGWKTEERSLVASPASRVRAQQYQQCRLLAQITLVYVEIPCFVGEWKHTLERFGESELAGFYQVGGTTRGKGRTTT